MQVSTNPLSADSTATTILRKEKESTVIHGPSKTSHLRMPSHESMFFFFVGRPVCLVRMCLESFHLPFGEPQQSQLVRDVIEIAPGCQCNAHTAPRVEGRRLGPFPMEQQLWCIYIFFLPSLSTERETFQLTWEMARVSQSTELRACGVCAPALSLFYPPSVFSQFSVVVNSFLCVWFVIVTAVYAD